MIPTVCIPASISPLSSPSFSLFFSESALIRARINFLHFTHFRLRSEQQVSIDFHVSRRMAGLMSFAAIAIAAAKYRPNVRFQIPCEAASAVARLLFAVFCHRWINSVTVKTALTYPPFRMTEPYASAQIESLYSHGGNAACSGNINLL